MNDLLTPLDVAALLAVLFCGVPHGAADAQLALRARMVNGVAALIPFTLGYVTIAIAFILVWLFLPHLALPIFFAMSAYHFGRGDALAHCGEDTQLSAIAHGGPILLLPIFQWSTVVPMLDFLSFGDAQPFWGILLAGAVGWLACTLFLLLNGRLTRGAALEIGGITLVFLVLPPLPAFALYFIGVHSARHFGRLITEVGLSRVSDWSLSIFLAIASIGLFLAATLWLDTGQFGENLLRVVFIGIAGLTVPHMLLIDGLNVLNRTKKKAPINV